MIDYRNPVFNWLKDLRINIEVEYLNALQAKSVATNQTNFEAFLIRESQISIQQIREMSTKIIDSLDYFIDQIPIIHNDLKLMKTNFSQINVEIQEIVRICRKKFINFTPNKNRLLDSVWRGSQQINKLIEFFTSKKSVNNSQLESTLRKLRENFGQLVNNLIKNETKIFVRCLQKRTGWISVKWSLLAVCSLAQNDAYMCRIFISFHKVLKPLLEILYNYGLDSVEETQQIKALTLKVLTILCTNEEAVRLLIEECLYNQFLTTIIEIESIDLITKEAMDLMVELSRSLIQTKCRLKSGQSIRLLICDFTDCLTKVMKSTTNEKIFLLCCSSVANISFVDSESITRNDMLNILLNSFNCFDHIYIRDQIITVLANISRDFPLEVVRTGGLIFIIDSLNLMMEEVINDEELLALERIQQKVSVAIARLAANQSVSQIFFRLNVIQRLIQLCKEPKERNFSEGVLIASIAALKRLGKVDKRLTKVESIANN